MKMKLSAFIVCLLFCLSLPMAAAAANRPLVVDEAGILSVSEVASLTQMAQKITDTYQCDTVIVTLADMGAGDSFTNAMDLYEAYDYGYGAEKNGILLMISMADRDFAMVVYGEDAKRAFTDYGQERIESRFLPRLSNGLYNEAFEFFLKDCETHLAAERRGEPIDVNTDPDVLRTEVIIKAVVCVVVPMLIALVVCQIWKGQMKTAVKQSTAHAYIPQNGFVLTGRADMFLYRTQTRRKIETSSSGGSGRSGGTTSNSRGFSGRSGKF